MTTGVGGVMLLPASEYGRDRRRWLEVRRSGLGASDTAAVLGLSPWKTALEVWLNKVHGHDDDAGEAARWGNVLEHTVARETARRWPELGKIAPSPGLLAHPEYRWMLATVDRVLVERGGGGGRVLGLLEVKTVGERMFRREWVDGVPPVWVQVQVQQQLAVTGLDRAWVACLEGGQKLHAPYPVERHDGVIARIVDYAGGWWADHVDPGHAGRPEPTFADRHRLAELWAADDAADALVAGEDEEATFADLLDARRRKREAAEDEDRALYRLKAAMRERTAIANGEGDVLATWKEQRQRRIDTKALRARHPELAARFTKETSTRVFRVKKQWEDETK